MHDKLWWVKKWEKCTQRQGESFAKVRMKIKMLSWNVRRVNNLEKKKVIKQFIRDQRVYLVCLQETKVQDMTLRMARSLGARRFTDWGIVDASRSTGGILLFWDKRNVEVIETVSGVFSVSCLFRNVEDDFQWIFTSVYGPVLANLKEYLWEELGLEKGLWSGLWCIGGDFNATISPSESNKGGRVT